MVRWGSSVGGVSVVSIEGKIGVVSITAREVPVK